MQQKERSVLQQAVRRMRRSFYVIGFFSFFINLLMLTAPLYMLQIYDRVLSSGSQSTLVALSILAVGMISVMGALEIIRSIVFSQKSKRHL